MTETLPGGHGSFATQDGRAAGTTSNGRQHLRAHHTDHAPVQTPGGSTTAATQENSAAGTNHFNSQRTTDTQVSRPVEDRPDSQFVPTTHEKRAVGATHPPGQRSDDTHTATTGQPTIGGQRISATREGNAADHFPASQGVDANRLKSAGGDQTPPNHPPARGRTQPIIEPPTGPNQPPTIEMPTPRTTTSAAPTPPTANVTTPPITAPPLGPILADPVLGLYADVVDDLENVRIANQNRLRQLTDTSEHGHGLSEDNPEIRKLATIVDALKTEEHKAILNLQKAMRAHPLGPWVKQTPGIGEKQMARLLASIRDPFWNDLHQRPRTVSELWSYAGFSVFQVPVKPPGGPDFPVTQSVRAAGAKPPADQQLPDTHQDSVGGPHTSGGHVTPGTHTPVAAGTDNPDSPITSDHQHRAAVGASSSNPDDQRDSAAHKVHVVGVAPHRRRGHKSNWNNQARQRIWLIAQSCIKQANSPYREIYDAAREKYSAATHSIECPRCGPAGKPAPIGSPLSLGHQHARATRIMCKEILRDLWRQAAAIHTARADEAAS